MRVNIYIKKENEARWDSISNKSGWVNEQVGKLNRNVRMTIPKETGRESVELEPTAYSTMYHINATNGTAVPTVLPPLVCKIHGIPLDSRGKCLQKGCKYA